MKKLMCVLLIGTIFIAGTGCAGSDPNPIAVYLPGDENKSCSALKAEIANIDKQVTRKKAQKKKQEGENILWFVTGWLLIVPWFFMDLKENEKPEINALQQRKDALLVIAAEKDCGF